MDKEFLKAGNPRKIVACYAGLLGAGLTKIVEDELEIHAKAIYALSVDHFEFAERQKSAEWRQKVSRYYYACYNASKAVRFHFDANLSTDVSDHKKIGELPNDFPNREYYKNTLDAMRTDRNSCDYDHAVTVTDLLKKPEETGKIAEEFLADVQSYCLSRGLDLR
ncbi:hypothetical protein ACO34A_11735 [Rhizobium sp. ACO-34A]|nr:hypothetical protein [Rhizobium sp. ACO-34A]ATN34472.1 hypothetical protein ACO34A_11735 [Rhizobium sp. ACO-34A]